MKLLHVCPEIRLIKMGCTNLVKLVFGLRKSRKTFIQNTRYKTHITQIKLNITERGFNTNNYRSLFPR